MQHNRDYKDIITGAAVSLFGAGVFAYAVTGLPLGTLLRMGPGMFPAGLGVLLVFLGLLILVPAFLRAGEMTRPDFLSCLTVVVAIAVFALLIERLGLFAAITGLVIVAAALSRKLSVGAALRTSAILVFLMYLVFSVGLGVSLPLVRWTF